MTDRAERIRELQERIAEVRRRLPKHSPPTAMMVELDELEYDLRQLLAQQGTPSGDDDTE